VRMSNHYAPINKLNLKFIMKV